MHRVHLTLKIVERTAYLLLKSRGLTRLVDVLMSIKGGLAADAV